MKCEWMRNFYFTKLLSFVAYSSVMMMMTVGRCWIVVAVGKSSRQFLTLVDSLRDRFCRCFFFVSFLVSHLCNVFFACESTLWFWFYLVRKAPINPNRMRYETSGKRKTLMDVKDVFAQQVDNVCVCLLRIEISKHVALVIMTSLHVLAWVFTQQVRKCQMRRIFSLSQGENSERRQK